MTILISAIVSTFNAADMLPECLHDLERQSISDQLEIIVVDSGSLQNEGIIVKEFQERYKNIRYIRTKSRETVYRAWNRGIRIARGRYITNANTDDRHRPDAFERMAGFLENHHEFSLVYADLIRTKIKNETFEKCNPSGRFRWHDWDRNFLLVKGCFVGPQPMWRRSVHELFGYFEEDFITSGDYEFWLRISQTLEFYHLPETLGLYLESPDSIEHRNRDRQAIENHRILSRYNKAAREGKIVLYQPFNELQKILLNELSLTQQKILDAFDLIEIPSGLKNMEFSRLSLSNLRESTKYFELKAKILEGNRSKDTIEQLMLVASRMVLNQTKWFQNYSNNQKNYLNELCSSNFQKLHKPNIDGKGTPTTIEMLESNHPTILDNRREDTTMTFRYFHEAAQNEAENISLKKNLAADYWAGFGRAEDALKLYIDILKTHPDDIDTLIAIGKLCQSLGLKDDARVFFERIIEIEPWNPDARSQLQQSGGSLPSTVGSQVEAAHEMPSAENGNVPPLIMRTGREL